MNTETFHDMNVVLRKLGQALSSARYGNDRSGMIPPDAIMDTVNLVAEAHATLQALLAVGRPRVVEANRIR